MHRPRLRSAKLKRVHDSVIGRWIVRKAAAVIATSQLEADELLADGVDRTRVYIRPNGVDIDALLPLPTRGSFRNSLGVADSERLVLSLARIAERRGCPTWSSATAQLPGVHCAIVGPDAKDGAIWTSTARSRRATFKTEFQ